MKDAKEKLVADVPSETKRRLREVAHHQRTSVTKLIMTLADREYEKLKGIDHE